MYAHRYSLKGDVMATWFGNMKTMRKLLMGFALMGAVMCVMGWVASQGLLAIRENLRIVYEDYTVAAVDLAHAATDMMRYRNNVIQATAAQDYETFAKFNSQQPDLKAHTLKSLEAYAATTLRVSTSGRSEEKDLQILRDAITAYYPAAELSMSLASESWQVKSRLEAEAIREKAKANATQNAGPKLIAAISALDQLLGTVSAVAKDMNDAGKATVANALLTLIVGTATAIVIGLFMGWLIARFLCRSLNNVMTASEALGAGNLSARSSVTTKDEIGHLATSFNAMGEQLQANVTKEREQAAKMEQFMVEAKRVLGSLAQGDLTDHMTSTCEGDFEQMKVSLNSAIQNLTATLMTVRTAAESVSTGAEEITKGNEDLSQRTSEQASSLEETSSAMEEMTSTVKQNADNAKQANQLAIAARDVADKGGAVTTKAVEAMGEINKSSKKIADIITVIDEIAFQTNLLALNAAVEAARAGEHGRGFAVVAAEVRNLAQRSATAAKEIKGLINESIQRVTDGSSLVDQSGKTLDEIVSSVKRVTDIIAEITAASQEQASGIDQVNKAIMQMDETTQQNAALVEEATSASQSMKEQARELMGQVGSFKLTPDGQEYRQRYRAEPESSKSGVSPASPVNKTMVKKSAAAHARVPDAVGVGNGTARRQNNNEFEEF
jgi:methyl-accepting chemotaxis protein